MSWFGCKVQVEKNEMKEYWVSRFGGDGETVHAEDWDVGPAGELVFYVGEEMILLLSSASWKRVDRVFAKGESK